MISANNIDWLTLEFECLENHDAVTTSTTHTEHCSTGSLTLDFAKKTLQ